MREFKERAWQVFNAKVFKTPYQDPISFLYSLPWDIPIGPAFPEKVMAEMNIALEDKSCFGRSVKGAVIAEKFFPEHVLYAGEVTNDLLRQLMLEMAWKNPEKWQDETFIAELLQYENPHMVLVDERGNQFDPIFKELAHTPQDLRHPKVLKHSLWEGLHAAYLVSEAILAQEVSALKCVEILERANRLYPEVIAVKESLAGMYCLVGQVDRAVAVVQEILGVRQDAKTIFFLWMLTGSLKYKHQIIEEYDVRVLEFLIQSMKI